MEKCHSGVSWLEPAIYRIRIQGTLDKDWSDYCSGMTIEHENDPKRESGDGHDGSIGRSIRTCWNTHFTA